MSRWAPAILAALLITLSSESVSMAVERTRIDDFTADGSRGGPLAWLKTLRANPSAIFHVDYAPAHWIREADLADLMAELESDSPAASVCYLPSTHVVPGAFQSTIGREAAILLDAFRNQRRYPGNCSDLQVIDPAELQRWWARRAPLPATRPAAGATIDESRTVALLAATPQSCVAIDLRGAIVLLDKAELERIVAARPPSWATESERQALIAANRVQRLLSQLSLETDAAGCFTSAGPLDAEAQYAVLSALESGAAAVHDSASGKTVAAVRVRYLGDRCGPTCGRGSITVFLPDARQPFLVVDWWVS